MGNCKGRKRSDPYKTLDECYARGETDECIKPTILVKNCVVEEGDSIIFLNFVQKMYQIGILYQSQGIILERQVVLRFKKSH